MKGKIRHEVRDPIHGFIHFDNLERDVINSRPFQRLRSIHQLALTYCVYPGATHRRFEHSFGVMEVASRLYDRLFRDLRGKAAEMLQENLDSGGIDYWRKVLRLSALLHDVGHLPFSHAAEADLMPDGWDHERMTAEFIRKSEIAQILEGATPPIRVEDVVDLAWQPSKRQKHEPEQLPDVWRTLLNDVITSDTFGADRIDYLLRDSHHAGVAYGRFDPDRLIGGMLVAVDESENPVLALQIGAIHAAEALLLARYFMYTQVYMHDVRRVYDAHLKDFLAAWLPGNRFTESWEDMLMMDDNRVLTTMWQAAGNTGDPLHQLAARIERRSHFKTVYELNPSHKRVRPTIVDDVFERLKTDFGEDKIRRDKYGPKTEANRFRVWTEEGELDHSLSVSDVISQLPGIEVGLVFAAPEVSEAAANLVRSEFKPVFDGTARRDGEGKGKS
ncbi:MAG TPA: HD domain-containing protein [Fimbriimonadaceae bacterium]|nr:HD domain-containing protein [Fimbriimonadaceae bacterium]